MDANKFNAIKDRARKLIQMDNAGQIDAIVESKFQSGELTFDGGYTPSMENGELFTESNQYQEAPMNFNSPSDRKLPKEILESFKSNQIDTSAFNTEASILDKMNILPKTPKKAVRTQINEAVSTTNTTSANVDYSLIKTIVEDAVKKYVGALGKKMLAENTQLESKADSVNAIKLGETFNFITNNGDLYEAKLVFKKNLKKK